MGNRKGIGGRKPLPDEIKELRGTLEERRARGKTPGIPLSKITQVTSARGIKVLQTERAKNIFKQKCNQVMGLNLLTEVDLDNLSIYAHNLDKIFDLMAEIKEEGDIITLYEVIHRRNGDIEQIPTKCVTNPKWTLYFKLVAWCDKIGGNFGFSPVARLKFGPVKEEKPEDPFAELKALTAGSKK